MSLHPLIQCEIRAPENHTDLMIKTITACAQESEASIHYNTTESSEENSILLHLPVDLAGSQHPVWCLVCRLACYFPSARVSVLVHGESSFPAPSSLESQAG